MTSADLMIGSKKRGLWDMEQEKFLDRNVLKYSFDTEFFIFLIDKSQRS